MDDEDDEATPEIKSKAWPTYGCCVGCTPEIEAGSVPHMASGHPISPGEAKGT